MHMHPTVTHAAADHRRQDYLAEAAANRNYRSPQEQLTICRRTQLLSRMTAGVDGFLTWLTREFAPARQGFDPEPHPGRPLPVYGPQEHVTSGRSD